MLLGFAVVMTARSPLIKVAGALVPPLMLFAIVVTANHYIIDAVAGGALAAFGLWLATRIDILPVQQRSADAYRRN
jgi:membrane-associated phospholipid phosphatase